MNSCVALKNLITQSVSGGGGSGDQNYSPILQTLNFWQYQSVGINSDLLYAYALYQQNNQLLDETFTFSVELEK